MVAFLDHLRLDRVVVVGTSRGGLIAMWLAATAKERLAGVLLNDIGPELAPEGLANIMSYLGVTPRARTYAEVAAALEARMGERFPGLPPDKWASLARRWFDEGADGIALNYDPRLRDAFAGQGEGPAVDLWPLFDALDGLPVAVVRGANSDLLTAETVAAMRARRPDLIVAEVPDRGHVPFLDEPEARLVVAYGINQRRQAQIELGLDRLLEILEVGPAALPDEFGKDLQLVDVHVSSWGDRVRCVAFAAAPGASALYPGPGCSATRSRAGMSRG